MKIYQQMYRYSGYASVIPGHTCFPIIIRIRWPAGATSRNIFSWPCPGTGLWTAIKTGKWIVIGLCCH